MSKVDDKWVSQFGHVNKEHVVYGIICRVEGHRRSVLEHAQIRMRASQDKENSSENSKNDLPLWTTRDGRELRLEEMFNQHLVNARVVISKWAKGEQDPELRRELKDWTRRFGRELRQRAKAWREKHGR